jgi:hypothetical protein
MLLSITRRILVLAYRDTDKSCFQLAAVGWVELRKAAFELGPFVGAN